MIPKIIHHIWIGNKPFPKEFEEFYNKWRIMYPEYNFIFWNDELVNASKLIDESISKYYYSCLLYTSPSPRDRQKSRMPSSA